MSGIRKEVVEVLAKLVPDDGVAYDITHKRRYARTLEVILDQNPQGSLLELGTSHVIPLALDMLGLKLDITVTEFDLTLPVSGSMICSVGTKKLEVQRYSVDLESKKLPAVDELFDVVLCCEVLEHMDIDPMFMLSEVNRVAKTGGKLILTTPNVTNTRAIWKILRGIEPYFYMQYHRDRSPYRHNYEHSVETVEAVLDASGFSSEIWTEDTFEDPVMEDINFLLGAGFKLNEDRLGDNIFAVGTKVSGVVDRYPGRIYV